MSRDGSVRASGTYSFEGVCVDLSRMSIERDGLPVSVEPKAMDVLVYLLEHRDRLVTKDELLDVVWKDTFVTPNVLTRAVAILRKALGDDAQESRIIATVSKRGYRWIAPVTEATSLQLAVPTAATTVQALEPGVVVDRRLSRTAIVAIAATIALGIAGVYWFVAEQRSSQVATPAGLTRLTTRRGYDSRPALSPDGRSLVYVSDRSGSLELYSTGLVPGSPELPLTSNGAGNMDPQWSPDGRWLAFHSLKPAGVWVMAAEGGTPQQIADFGVSPSWSPDSERLVFVSDPGNATMRSVLWTVRRDGTDRRALSLAAPMPGGISTPSWSNTGRFIAFGVDTGAAFRSVWIAAADGSTVRQVATRMTGRGLQWTPNDDALLWCGYVGSTLTKMVRLAINPSSGEPVGEPSEITQIDVGVTGGFSVARDGRAVLGIERADSNLWQIAIGPGAADEPQRLTDDTVRKAGPRMSPDGHIAFVEFIEGHAPAVWIMNLDGSGRTPLLQSGHMQGPHWSRDGQRVFVLLNGEPTWVDLATRRTTRLQGKVEVPNGISLSPDDSALLVHRNGTNGVVNLWRQPLDGTAAQQMTFDAEGATYGVYSPDGRWIALELSRGADTWAGVMQAQPGAAPVPIVKARGQSWVYSWSPDSRHIAFVGERAGIWNVFEVARATGEVRQLTHFTNPQGFVRYPFWSQKGDRIVFERSIAAASLWTAKLW